MTEALLGAAAAFGVMVVQKSILEPLAKNAGRKVLEHNLEGICKRLDELVCHFGVDFDAERAVRVYLDLNEPAELTEAQLAQVMDEVFKTWDLRKAKRT